MLDKLLELLKYKFYLALLILGCLLVVLSSVEVKDLKSFSHAQQPAVLPLYLGLFMVGTAVTLGVVDQLSIPFFLGGVKVEKDGYAINVGRASVGVLFVR